MWGSNFHWRRPRATHTSHCFHILPLISHYPTSAAHDKRTVTMRSHILAPDFALPNSRGPRQADSRATAGSYASLAGPYSHFGKTELRHPRATDTLGTSFSIFVEFCSARPCSNGVLRKNLAGDVWPKAVSKIACGLSLAHFGLDLPLDFSRNSEVFDCKVRSRG